MIAILYRCFIKTFPNNKEKNFAVCRTPHYGQPNNHIGMGSSLGDGTLWQDL